MPGKPTGYLPCFHNHDDKKYPIRNFYQNGAFVGKVEQFVSVIITCKDVTQLRERLGRYEIQNFDPVGNEQDKQICRDHKWTDGKLYRLDYGDVAHRLIFGLDNKRRRCHILGLDSNHKTFK